MRIFFGSKRGAIGSSRESVANRLDHVAVVPVVVPTHVVPVEQINGAVFIGADQQMGIGARLVRENQRGAHTGNVEVGSVQGVPVVRGKRPGLLPVSAHFDPRLRIITFAGIKITVPGGKIQVSSRVRCGGPSSSRCRRPGRWAWRSTPPLEPVNWRRILIPSRGKDAHRYALHTSHTRFHSTATGQDAGSRWHC